MLSLRDRQWAIYQFVTGLLHPFIFIIYFHGDVIPEVDFLGWELSSLFKTRVGERAQPLAEVGAVAMALPLVVAGTMQV